MCWVWEETVERDTIYIIENVEEYLDDFDWSFKDSF